jgi:hypothetical protein
MRLILSDKSRPVPRGGEVEVRGVSQTILKLPSGVLWQRYRCRMQLSSDTIVNLSQNRSARGGYTTGRYN